MSLPGDLRAAEHLAQPADLGLRLADQEDLLAGPGLVQLGPKCG